MSTKPLQSTPNHINFGKWSLINYRPDELEQLARLITIPPEVKKFLGSLYIIGPQYPAVAIFKFLLLFAISSFKHLSAYYRWAMQHEQFLLDLGFTKSFDLWVPSYKTIWHFMHIRIGRARIYNLFHLTLRVILPVLRKAGNCDAPKYEIGARALLDATPLEATTRDKDASYNGHYKKSCYLWHRLICADTGIPLEFEVTTGSIHEGHIGPALVFRARLNYVPVKELWFDMKYAFGEALASYFLMRVTTHHRIAASWKASRRYDWSSMLHRYYKMWRSMEYKIDASHDYILKFLALHGHLSEVGLYLRNLRVREYQEAPERYIRSVSIRSSIEASNGYVKRHSVIEDREFRGLAHVTVHVGFYEMGRLILAYSRGLKQLREISVC